MLPRISFVLAAALFACGSAALAGCGDETGGGQGGSGTGGPSGSSTSSSASGSGGSGEGGAGGSGGGAGGGSACHGDGAAWQAATTDLTCETNSDCCVIVNGCINAAQVVTASKTDAAKAAWQYCDNLCTDCIPPAVMVECSADKKCVGYKVPFEDNPPPELSEDHCGKDAQPVMMMNPAVSFICGG